MVTETYQLLRVAFIQHTLGDLAERRTDSGEYLARGQRRTERIHDELRRVFIHGDRICYQGNEFHDSDSECRLSMALAAGGELASLELGRAWGTETKASLVVAEVLAVLGCERLRRRFRDAKATVGDDGKPISPPGEQISRLAATIRRQVRRYRADHPGWKREFESSLAAFRADYFRDPEWYQEAEERNLAWLAEFEKRETVEWYDAGRIVVLARLYQQQQKFDLAAATFHKAILIARRALMHEDFRMVVLLWLRTGVKASKRKLRPVPDPSYRGPRTHTDTRRAEISRDVPRRYSGLPYDGFRLPL